jgi:type IV pilus biogenesis protein CpaD/CtpE
MSVRAVPIAATAPCAACAERDPQPSRAMSQPYKPDNNISRHLQGNAALDPVRHGHARAPMRRSNKHQYVVQVGLCF